MNTSRHCVNTPKTVTVYTMDGDTRQFPIDTVKNTVPRVIKWLGLTDIRLFQHRVENALKDTDILICHASYYAIPHNPEVDKAFINACIRGDILIVQHCIDAGADINAPQNGTMSIPLHIAIICKFEASIYNSASPVCKYTSIARLLINNGVDVNRINKDGYTPLQDTSLFNDDNIMIMLLDAGADINSTGSLCVTPLQIAIENCSLRCIGILRSRGAVE